MVGAGLLPSGASSGHLRADDLLPCFSQGGPFPRVLVRTAEEMPLAAVVRSPWDRVVSAYTYLRALDDGAATAPPRDAHYTRELRRLSATSFADFVHRVLPHAAQSWSLFVPQTRFTHGAAEATASGKRPQLVRHIFRHESLVEREGELLALLGLDSSPLGDARLFAEGRHCEAYTPALAEAVGRLLWLDVRTFGYEFPCVCDSRGGGGCVAKSGGGGQEAEAGDLVVLVLSGRSHTEDRRAIRETWGRRRTGRDVFFFVGESPCWLPRRFRATAWDCEWSGHPVDAASQAEHNAAAEAELRALEAEAVRVAHHSTRPRTHPPPRTPDV